MKPKTNHKIFVQSGTSNYEFDANTLDELDLVAMKEEQFHILLNHRSYKAEIVEADFARKTFRIKINGNLHTVSISDRFDLLVKELGLTVNNTQKLKDVKAPMPGLVLEVNVERGTEVQKGDTLIILEAMKMENILKSNGEGIVKNIVVKEGQAVDKGQLLIEME